MEPRPEADGSYSFNILMDNLASFTGGYEQLQARYEPTDYGGATGSDYASYYGDSTPHNGDDYSSSYYGLGIC